MHEGWMRRDDIHLLVSLAALALFSLNQVLSVRYPTFHYPGQSVYASYLIVLSVWMFLLRCHASSRVGRFFSSIGRLSLDIYILHYVFLVGFGDYFARNCLLPLPWLVQLLAMLTGAFVLLFLSLLFSRVIRKNRLLVRIILSR